MQLTKGQIAEIKNLYTGDWGSVRELSRIFGVSENVIRWLVNYKNYREQAAKYTKEWRKKNPERNKIIERRSSRKYYERHRKEFNLYQRIYQKRRRREYRKQIKGRRVKTTKLTLWLKNLKKLLKRNLKRNL